MKEIEIEKIEEKTIEDSNIIYITIRDTITGQKKKIAIFRDEWRNEIIIAEIEN